MIPMIYKTLSKGLCTRECLTCKKYLDVSINVQRGVCHEGNINYKPNDITDIIKAISRLNNTLIIGGAL